MADEEVETLLFKGNYPFIVRCSAFSTRLSLVIFSFVFGI
jgi:hypothetical protein